MKNYLLLILSIFILSACGASKDYLERSNADKALVDAAKRLEKNPKDEKALEAVPILYKEISKERLAKIKLLQGGRDANKWDKILNEYDDLQNAYEAILGSSAAFKIISPVSYTAEILETKEKAAGDYYAIAESIDLKSSRDNAKKAYSYYKKVDKYSPGYKDSRSQMNKAYDAAIVKIIINPIQDNSYFFNTGWGNSGYNYSNEYFQQNLIRDLQNNEQRYAAEFYTDWEARRNNVQPDWVIDLTLRDIDLPQPRTYTSQRQVSNRIEKGTDTSGRKIYETVNATIYITQQSFTARARMDVNIRDISTRQNISYRSFSDDYRWQDETATYRGDSRALSQNDWNMINNRSFNQPRRQDVLGEIYRKLYPQIRNSITYSVDW